MKQFETETMLLARPLQQLARTEQHSAYPLAGLYFVTLVEKHNARLEYHIQFDPVL